MFVFSASLLPLAVGVCVCVRELKVSYLVQVELGRVTIGLLYFIVFLVTLSKFGQQEAVPVKY